MDFLSPQQQGRKASPVGQTDSVRPTPSGAPDGEYGFAG
jgi:hypothetical protein